MEHCESVAFVGSHANEKKLVKIQKYKVWGKCSVDTVAPWIS